MSFASTLDKLNDFQKSISSSSTNSTSSLKDGFQIPASYSPDTNHLPYNQVPENREGTFTRNIMTFFVPQFGIVKMYVNPNNLQITEKKLITKERTKGGYSLQYWGEDLTDISISGNTGSSGVEGINVLYEVYRAEQYAFDGTALTLDAVNANNSFAKDITNKIDNSFGGFGSILTAATGLDTANTLLAPANIPSLGQLAFSVEIYYCGVVYRGFFESFNVTETADNFMFTYQMKFTATQKRGYRTNIFPWNKSPKSQLLKSGSGSGKDAGFAKVGADVYSFSGVIK